MDTQPAVRGLQLEVLACERRTAPSRTNSPSCAVPSADWIP